MTELHNRSPEVGESKVEALAYFVVSPDSRPGCRTYDDEDLLAGGGIHAIERDLEHVSYWYAYWGRVWGRSSPSGVHFKDSELAQLPNPKEIVWNIGRRNPAFRGSEMERYAFYAAFQALNHMLDSWRRKDEDGMVEEHTLKELKISTRQLASIAKGLQTLPTVHEIIEASVMKYWYDSSWPGPNFPDLVLAEFCLRIPLRFRRSTNRIITVDILPLACC